ncbi:unnamed protein product [Callosobruchus maculatus]|uniref:Uncharacterized protein n=1 Tax=Callosobruchus maculatus TaxID=64391 RepID=A0A653CP33_CALMS|nr:unnamed protein product [Callosobruchus maculatus]
MVCCTEFNMEEICVSSSPIIDIKLNASKQFRTVNQSIQQFMNKSQVILDPPTLKRIEGLKDYSW